ncbi:hypothetical protein, partial [Stenotrophomonas maltophilia]|uniref:hypothetical protein n=1 Tax=Stenotrophomonas maltophilia TaxID=40324 RepID=UPI001146A04B
GIRHSARHGLALPVELQPCGHRPATPLRPNTPTWPGRGKGPDRPSCPGPDQLSIGEGAMRNRVTRRYFRQLFALYAGFVRSR